MVKTDVPVSSPTPVVRSARIYTMPEKFYVDDKSGGGKKSPLLFVLILILVVAVLGGGGFVVYKQLNKPAPTNTVVTNDQPVNSNINAVTNTNATLNVNASTNINQTNTNATLNVNASTNSVFLNVNTSTNTNAVTLTSSEDSDSDGLTNVEEALYGTSLSVADTDGDGFADGQEVVSGYDPNAPVQKIALNAGIQTHTSTANGYTILYPRSWIVSADPQNTRGELFSTSGEFISISVQDNPALLSARDWYLSKSPGVNISAVQNVSNWNHTLQGVKSLDGTSVYFTLGAYVYVVSYKANILSDANYLTTFSMMYQSLTATTPSSNTNTATNANVNAVTNTNSNSNTNRTNTNTGNTNTNSNRL
ncbi:MAG: hypothetical protein ACOYUK_04595 [Patescibacteria group bacterium]